MLSTVSVAVGIAILVGVAGIIIPVLPGVPLILGAILVWALVAQTTLGWWVLGICAVIAAIGYVLQYLIPGRRMKQAGVPTATLVAGALAGVVGFFVIPVAGLPIGFVLGVFVVEILRLRTWDEAWPSTVHALKAAALSYGIELTAAMAMAITWGIGVWRTFV